MIRAYDAGDAEAVDAIIKAAFGAHSEAIIPLVADLRRTHARAELVAVSDSGHILGHTMLSRSWVDARAALVEVLVLSPLSVAPDHQGQGLGTALVRAAVEAARSLRAPALFLEGSPAYYSVRGFVPAAPLGFARPSVRVPEPAFQVVLLPGLERWMRGALVYCEPFWMHDCVGLRNPQPAEVEGREKVRDMHNA